MKRCHCAMLQTEPTKQLSTINRKLQRKKGATPFNLSIKVNKETIGGKNRLPNNEYFD